MLGLLSCAGTLQQEQATGTQQSIADLSRHSDAPVVFSSIFAQFNSTLQVPRQQQRDVHNYGMHTDPSIVNHDLTCLHTLTTYCKVASGPNGHFNVPKSGCMLPTAVNFDILATVHDAAVCIFETRKFTYLQRGCTLSGAVNYDSRATVSDASCMFKSSSSAVRMNLRRERLESKNVLAPIETGKQMIPLMTPQRRGSADSRAYGCTDSLAANFDRLADENDGSCVLSPGGCNLHGVIGLPPSVSIPSLSCDPSSKSGCTKRWATNFDDSALLDGTRIFIIGLFPMFPYFPILVTARRVRRGRPPPPLVWVLCRPLVQTNHVKTDWELCDESILFRVLDASERAAEGVAGAFAVLDGHSRSSVALRVVIIFRIGDGPERLVRRRDRDRAF